MKKKGEKTIEIFRKVMGPIKVLLPAVITAAFIIGMLAGYTSPKEEVFSQSRPEVESLKDIMKERNVVEVADADPASLPVKKDKGKATDKTGNSTVDISDGQYQGSANGYGGKINVEVTVKNKKITQIDILSAPNETDSFFNRAKSVISSILSAQSADVDTVSGATYSSRGIIGAVKNALYGMESSTPLGSDHTPKPKGSKNIGKVKESGNYEDGTYNGSAKGFGGTIKVKVTIKNGKLSKIKLVSASGESGSYLSKAKSLLKTIKKKQTTNVDAVSGATYSSNGIIKAVRNALKKADKDKKNKKSKKNKKNKKNKKKSKKKKNSPSKQPFKDGDYQDGTFVGTAEGFDGNITVKVTIKNGKIASVEVTDHSGETDTYYKQASAVINTIVKKNSPNVDAISGATYSSTGIINAVKNALNKAKGGKEDNKPAPDQTTQSGKDNTGSNEGDTTEPATEISYQYNDGEYQVTSACHDEYGEFSEYDLNVTVTIKNDKITDVKVEDIYIASNASYLDRAKRIIPKIVEKGTPEGVDTISRATCSSKAIKEACKKALEMAKK